MAIAQSEASSDNEWCPAEECRPVVRPAGQRSASLGVSAVPAGDVERWIEACRSRLSDDPKLWEPEEEIIFASPLKGAFMWQLDDPPGGEGDAMREWSGLTAPAVRQSSRGRPMSWPANASQGSWPDFVVPATPQRGQSLAGRQKGDASKRRARAGAWRADGNVIATSEGSPSCSAAVAWQADDCITVEETLDCAYGGNCGFTVAVGPASPASAGKGPPAARRLAHPGMCHHYTWDGLHCVRSGLGSEHANRCHGQMCAAGVAFGPQVCQTVGISGICHTTGAGGDLVEAVCSPPALARAACTPECCPFLAEGRSCPYDILGRVSLVYRL